MKYPTKDFLRDVEGICNEISDYLDRYPPQPGDNRIVNKSFLRRLTAVITEYESQSLQIRRT